MAGPQPFTIGLDLFRYVVFGDPNWDFRKFDFDADIERTEKASRVLNALDPDLKKFAARGVAPVALPEVEMGLVRDVDPRVGREHQAEQRRPRAPRADDEDGGLGGVH